MSDKGLLGLARAQHNGPIQLLSLTCGRALDLADMDQDDTGNYAVGKGRFRGCC